VVEGRGHRGGKARQADLADSARAEPHCASALDEPEANDARDDECEAAQPGGN
jgi:hypothetical protein